MVGKEYQIFGFRLFDNYKLLSSFESQFLDSKFGETTLPYQVSVRIKTANAGEVYHTRPER